MRVRRVLRACLDVFYLAQPHEQGGVLMGHMPFDSNQLVAPQLQRVRSGAVGHAHIVGRGCWVLDAM